MSLTRKLLKGMGLTEEQVDTVIEAHTETVEGLKKEAEQYKQDALSLPGVKKERDEAKKALEQGEKDPWKEKYEATKKEYDDFKGKIASEKQQQAKEKAYQELLKEIGVSESRLATVLRVSDLGKVELDDSGKLKEADQLKEAAKKEWADFIPTTEVKGAETSTPPKTDPSKKDPFEAGFDGE